MEKIKGSICLKNFCVENGMPMVGGSKSSNVACPAEVAAVICDDQVESLPV